jgi:hypothetical protein
VASRKALYGKRSDWVATERFIYRLAEGLPQQRADIQHLAHDYADAVVQRDWPDMAASRLPEDSHFINEQMWRTRMSIKVSLPSELMAEDHALSELSSLTMHRRTRLLQSSYQLPSIFCLSRLGTHQQLGIRARAGDDARDQISHFRLDCVERTVNRG